MKEDQVMREVNAALRRMAEHESTMAQSMTKLSDTVNELAISINRQATAYDGFREVYSLQIENIKEDLAALKELAVGNMHRIEKAREEREAMRLDIATAKAQARGAAWLGRVLWGLAGFGLALFGYFFKR